MNHLPVPSKHVMISDTTKQCDLFVSRGLRGSLPFGHFVIPKQTLSKLLTPASVRG